jgi:CubicO group peptidase (beta-lactamase class C family)
MTDPAADGRRSTTQGALRRVLDELVAERALPGAAVAIVEGDEVTVVRGGSADLAGRRPMGDTALFPLTSVTKPIVSALAAGLVEDGVVAPDDPVERWVPELASPPVLSATAVSPQDVVPAVRPALVGHLLDSTSGWGFPGDLFGPGITELVAAVGDGRRPDELPDPDTWVARLAGVPLMRQPGDRWLYETSHDLLGVVLARAAGRPLPALLAERLLRPLGMGHTGFAVAAADRGHVVQAVRSGEDGTLRAADAGDPAAMPRFPSGAGGLVASLDDLVRFARMLLGGGELDGVRVLTPASVEAMTSDRLTPAQRGEGGFFLDGQSWGQGGAVDIAPREPWQAPGRYGWVGVSGTSLHVRRDRGTAVICLTARELWTARDTAVLERIWTAAAADG